MTATVSLSFTIGLPFILPSQVGAKLIDADGVAWSFGAANGANWNILYGAVLRGVGVILVLDSSKIVWMQNAAGSWFVDAPGGVWGAKPGPPAGYVAPSGGPPPPPPPPPAGTLLDAPLGSGWTVVNGASSRSNANTDGTNGWLAWGYATLQRYVNFTASGEYTFTVPAFATGVAAPVPPQSGMLLLVDGIPVGTVGQPSGFEWANCVNNLTPSKPYVWKGSFLAGTRSVVLALNAVNAQNGTYPSGYAQQAERMTIAATGVGYPAEPAGNRDPTKSPLSSLHFMNQALKDGATWSVTTDGDQQMLVNMNVVTVNSLWWTTGLWTGQATDPVWSWRVSGTDSHVVGDNTKTYSVHAPQNMTPSPGDNGLLITDATNSRYQWSMFNATTDSTLHTATSLGLQSTGVIIDSYNATEHAYHQQFGVVAGMIRQWELDAGAIQHKLVFGMAGNMMTKPQSNWTGFGWPAAESDYNAPTGQYSGVPGIQYGALIGIPPNVTMPTTLSVGGQILWRQLQTYGGIVGVQAGAPNREIAIYAEMGASGSNLTGLNNDWPSILQFCRICRNNTRSTPNGIGNPLAPMLPGVVQGLPTVTH